jgi:protein-disulfide isomerase
MPSIVADYVRPNRLKLVYRGIQIIGPNSQAGLRAIYAAGRQDKLWNVADALYRRQGAENSGWITASVLSEAAATAGANGAAIKAAAPTAAVTAQLTAAEHQARADRIRGTPTFILERPPSLPQQLHLAALDPATFEAALAVALQ